MGTGGSRFSPLGNPTLGELLGPGCFSEVLVVGCWSWLLFFVWLVTSLVIVVYTVLMTAWAVVINLQAVVTYLALPLVISWFWWYVVYCRPAHALA